MTFNLYQKDDQELSIQKFERLEFQADRISILEGTKSGRYLVHLSSENPKVYVLKSREGVRHPEHQGLGYPSRQMTLLFSSGG